MYHITYYDRYPHRELQLARKRLHGSSDTHVGCTGRGVGDTLPNDHTRARSHHTSNLSRWRQGWQVGLTKATHGSAREGGASRDSPMHQRDARRTRHHTPVTLMSGRLHGTFAQSTHTHDQEPIDDYQTTLGDKCNDRHKACRPHLSHNVFDRYPHKRELQRARIGFLEPATG